MSWEEVKRVWKSLHQDPELRKEMLPAEIYDSWERCYSYQVPQFKKKLTNILTAGELRRAKEKSAFLCEIAQPVMDLLAEFVHGSGFAVVLANMEGVTLRLIGDRESLFWANENNMGPGVIGTEREVGASALPLSLKLVKPVSVLSYEHFCLLGIPTTSSYAPIVDGGQLVGSIGMIAPYKNVSYHTLGMAVMAAAQIQSSMTLNRISKCHQGIMNSMTDGLMGIEPGGTITYINNACLKMLNLKSRDVLGVAIQTLFGRNGRNESFISLALQKKGFTDDVVTIHSGGVSINCHVTCAPMHTPSRADSSCLLILRERVQMNRMVGKWIGSNAKFCFKDIIGETPALLETLEVAHTTAHSDSGILLLGESGTGKDILAQSIHNASPRRCHPFIAVNCAALPRELIASELFGYEEGAFTGARKGGRIGKFELADQGTLFLDEIGDMPYDLQASLLRVLEEKSVVRLGGNRTIPVNIRIIAATNSDLETEIAHNRFRRDLYYRLGVIRLALPPLCDRIDDIPLLAQYFLKQISNRYGKPGVRITEQAVVLLTKYHWPGNIRELQNVLEGSLQIAPDGVIDHELIAHYMNIQNIHSRPSMALPSPPVPAPPAPPPVDGDAPDGDSGPAQLEYMLKKYKYNKTDTAKALGISRKSLYKRLEKYGFR